MCVPTLKDFYQTSKDSCIHCIILSISITLGHLSLGTRNMCRHCLWEPLFGECNSSIMWHAWLLVGWWRHADLWRRWRNVGWWLRQWLLVGWPLWRWWSVGWWRWRHQTCHRHPWCFCHAPIYIDRCTKGMDSLIGIDTLPLIYSLLMLGECTFASPWNLDSKDKHLCVCSWRGELRLMYQGFCLSTLPNQASWDIFLSLGLVLDSLLTPEVKDHTERRQLWEKNFISPVFFHNP